jgi:hypothetical protein
MEMLSETQELDIFNNTCVQDIIEYKWNQYGRRHHFLGMAMHVFYTLMLLIYVNAAYLKETDSQRVYTLLLAIGVIYPGMYEYRQLKNVGAANYFADLSNYTDCIYNWGSIMNVFLQNILGPYHTVCRIIMIIIVL